MALQDYFVWGKGGAKLTPEQIEREREIAAALVKQGNDFSPVGHWTQGAARMANALVGNIREGRADRAQQEGIAGANEAFNNSGIAQLLTGGSAAYPSAVAAGASPTSSADTGNFNGDVKSGILATANALGIDPVDLATAISYETGGTFDPTKSGPTTKWGTHRGLIQFGEPQAQKYGVDWSDPIGSQLGENGAVAKYLRDTGVTPGMGLLDIYSAINAGGVGRYNRSDTAAGGAPGTVRDKVEQQMAAHRQKALAMFGDASQPNAGVQVASADPNFVPEQAYAPVAEALNSPQQAIASVAPQGNPVSAALSGQLLYPNTRPETVRQNDIALGGALAPQGTVAPQQMAGSFPPAPSMGQPSMLGQQQTVNQPNLQGLIEVINNPFANQSQKAMAQMALQQVMQQNDPMRALQMQAAQQGLTKGELEIAAMQQPKPQEYGFQTLGDGTVVRTNKFTGEVEPVYEGALKPTGTMQELEAAGLIPGTPEYQQAIRDSQRRGTSVTTNVGGEKEDAKFWEGMGAAQAKTFSDMMDNGNVARRNRVNLDRLSQLSAQSAQGLQGAVIGTLANLGIKLGEGAGNVEAMESLISQLVPSQRPPGSGTISDADLALYKASLPRVINSQKGNQLILETLYAINDHDIKAAEIADRVANRELTPAEARVELRNLPNPFDNWEEKLKLAGADGAATTGKDGWQEIGGVKIRKKQ